MTRLAGVHFETCFLQHSPPIRRDTLYVVHGLGRRKCKQIRNQTRRCVSQLGQFPSENVSWDHDTPRDKWRKNNVTTLQHALHKIADAPRRFVPTPRRIVPKRCFRSHDMVPQQRNQAWTSYTRFGVQHRASSESGSQHMTEEATRGTHPKNLT